MVHFPNDEDKCFACPNDDRPGGVILVATTNGPCCMVCLKDMLALPLERLRPSGSKGGAS